MFIRSEEIWELMAQASLLPGHRKRLCREQFKGNAGASHAFYRG
jgi:hypothetical protein